MKMLDAITTAINVAATELRGAPIDDIMDCVYCLLDDDMLFRTYEDQIHDIITKLTN
jgi:hypothetical protein